MAAGTLHLEIVTPEGVQLVEEVSSLTAPSVDGQFGALPGHRPLLASLATGLISYTKAGQAEPEQVAVGSGYVEIHDDQAIVITERFCRKSDVDAVEVRQELKDADRALDEFTDERNSARHAELVADELWAAARLELYGDPPPPTVRGYTETRPIEDLFQGE